MAYRITGIDVHKKKLAVRLYWMMRQGWDYQQWSKLGSQGWFATSKSGLPSPSRRPTVPLPELATTTSGWPSWFTSATTAESPSAPPSRRSPRQERERTNRRHPAGMSLHLQM